MYFRSVGVLVFLLAVSTLGYGQTPEYKQMLVHAREYVKDGNAAAAITTYRQALQIVPGDTLVMDALWEQMYHEGMYHDIVAQLADTINSGTTCRAAFCWLAIAYDALYDYKKARKTLDDGMIRFPKSAMLYHESGINYIYQKKNKLAIMEWIHGATVQPYYALNYIDLSYEMYQQVAAADVLTGLICAETYLLLPHNTTDDDTVKKLLLVNWKKMFDAFGRGGVEEPIYASEYCKQWAAIYATLTPVISDGVTMENLTMARVRFLMQWRKSESGKYVFPFFDYQEQLVKNGKFEIFNEWLFGKAESETAFSAWNIFHPSELSRTMEWLQQHPFAPTADGVQELFQEN